MKWCVILSAHAKEMFILAPTQEAFCAAAILNKSYMWIKVQLIELLGLAPFNVASQWANGHKRALWLFLTRMEQKLC